MRLLIGLLVVFTLTLTAEEHGTTEHVHPAAGSKVLLIAANPAVAKSTTGGWPVGYWAAEVTHPYDTFIKAGLEVTIASPQGGKLEPDAFSLPSHESGYSAHDTTSATYFAQPDFMELLDNTPSIDDLKVADFDAIVVVGGQSPMFTFGSAKNLHGFFQKADDQGKIVAALCHGTSLLLHLKKADGTPYVKGLTMTGFTNEEEDAADAAVGQKMVPFRIEDEAKKLGANFVAGPAFASHAIRSGNLITGQQQASGHAVADLVLIALAGQRAKK